MKNDSRKSLKTVVFLTCLAFLSAILPYGNAKGDDSFITFRLVTNFVDHAQLAYNLSEPVYAFTSPLWFFILSGLYLLVGNIFLAAYIASSIALVFAVISLWMMTGSLIDTRWLRISAIVFLLIDHWFMRWALSGQEIAMKIGMVAFLIWLVSLHIHRTDNKWFRYVLTGVAFAAGLLTRPEIGLLLVVTILVLVKEKQAQGALVVFFTAGALYSIWAVFCYCFFGEYLPHTILVKSANLAAGLQVMDMLRRVFTHSLPRFLGVVLLDMSCLVVLTLYLMRKAKGRLLDTVKDPVTTLLALLWILGVSVAYFVIGAWMASMYTLIFTPFIPIVCVAMIEGLSKQIQRPRAGTVVAWSMVFSLLVTAGVFVLGFGKYSWLSSSDYDRGDDIRYIQLAEWIDKNLPRDSRIATGELGIVGFFGRRYMIDLEGIATPELLAKDKRPALVRLRPTHFSLYGMKITEYLGFRLKEIRSANFRRIGGMYAFKDEEETCTLYEVENSGHDSTVIQSQEFHN